MSAEGPSLLLYHVFFFFLTIRVQGVMGL
jgi:hypothetical protein